MNIKQLAAPLFELTPKQKIEYGSMSLQDIILLLSLKDGEIAVLKEEIESRKESYQEVKEELKEVKEENTNYYDKKDSTVEAIEAMQETLADLKDNIRHY